MKTRDIIQGLEILDQYRNRSGYDVGCEHDAIYAFPTDVKLVDSDIQKMIDLGWHQEHEEVDYNTDFSISDYRQEESWVGYC